MRRPVIFAFLAVLVTGGALDAAAPPAGDSAAAERQYRLAQRLGADGSADAAAAFEKVVVLAPAGPYADDALVDLARLSGAPDWPEEVGGLDPQRAARSRTTLEKVVGSYAEGDRASEARYRLALLRLAPPPGRDPAAAREQLIALAGGPVSERWTAAARYALGVLAEQDGAMERAAGSFARVLVERPGGDVAARAEAGYGRTLLAAGRYGEAAAWLQASIDGGATTVRAEPHRELALREVVSERVPARRWPAIAAPLPTIPTAKGAVLLAQDRTGRIVVFDRKNDALQSFDEKGHGAADVALPDVTAVAADPFGRIFVATKDKLWRWDAGRPVVVTALGAFGSPAALAVDAGGAVWLADRKGDRIARWVLGTPAPVVLRESKGAGIAALAIVGGGVIAAEERSGRLVVITAAGTETSFGATAFRRPIALTADAAGRVSVLDEKAETITRLTATGQVAETLSTSRAGVGHPLALTSTPAGALLILDGDSGAVAVAR